MGRFCWWVREWADFVGGYASGQILLVGTRVGRFCWWVREWADFVGGYVSGQILLVGT